jgi:hypothetical protein
MLHAMTFFAEAPGEIGGGLLVVLDQQDLAAHPYLLRCAVTDRSGGSREASRRTPPENETPGEEGRRAQFIGSFETKTTLRAVSIRRHPLEAPAAESF